MTIWFWGDGSEFEHYFEPPKLYYQKPKRQKTNEEEFEHYFPRKRSNPPKLKKEKENLAEVEAQLRAALEEVALSHPASLRKLMQAPEGTPRIGARGKRRTSEFESDYDSWKPNYHQED